MQCHKCRFDSRNGGTEEERQRHCLNCDFSEVFSKPAFPFGDSLTDALVEKQSMSDYEHGQGRDGDGGCNPDNPDNADGLDNEIDMLARSEFVRRFAQLNWRCQQIILGIINHGNSNKAINGMTKFAVSTIVAWRHKLQADEYWGTWLSRLSARQRSRRKRTMKPPAARTHDCNGAFHERRGAGR